MTKADIPALPDNEEAGKVADRLIWLADNAWFEEKTLRIAARWIEHLAKAAALSRTPGDAVAVKPLVWSTPSPSANYPEWRAHNLDIKFEAVIDTSRALCFGKFPLAINGHTGSEKFDTIDAAKAAAQANYEARIRSALHPAPAAPAGEIEAVKAAIRRACADEVNGRPNGDIIVKGCEAAEYVNPEDAAASFVDSIAEEVCAALSASPAPGAIAPGVDHIGDVTEMLDEMDPTGRIAAAIRSGEKA